MLDPTIAKLLKSGSYATFAEMMSKYRHDLVNRQSNLILTSQIIAKLISRLPDSPSIPEVLRQQQLLRIRQILLQLQAMEILLFHI